MDDLTPAQRESIDALRASRGACPPAETLVEYESLGAADRERHRDHAHIAICSRCQLAVLQMAEPAAASSMTRWMLPLAAIVVLAVGITIVGRRDGASVPPDPGTVRGTELQVIAPAGSVDTIRQFTWQSPIRAERYRVIVRKGTTVIWQTEVTGPSAPAPPVNVIERDVQYEWVVEAIDREGNVRMTSPPQPFSVF